MAITVKLVLFWIFNLIFDIWALKRNKAAYALDLILVWLCLISTDATGLISGTAYTTGGVVNVTMVSYAVLILAGTVLVLDRKAIPRSRRMVLVPLLLVAFIILFRLAMDGTGAFSNKVVDNYVVPVLFAILLSTYMKKEDIRQFLTLLVILVSLNAAVAVVEYFLEKSLFFHDYYYINSTWYMEIYLQGTVGIPFRTTALLGHPLVSAFYYLVAFIYLTDSDTFKLPFKVALGALLIFGIYSTNSRSVLLVLGIYILYWFLSRKKYKELVILVALGVLVLVLFDYQALYQKLFARDTAGGSLMRRAVAITGLRQIPWKILLLGAGFNQSANVFGQYYGEVGNFEISYLMYLVELGAIAFVAWLCLFPCFLRKPQNAQGKTVWVMVCAALLMAAFSNSIGDSGTLFTFVLGLCALTGGKENGSRLAS